MLHSLTGQPAYVLGRRWDVLAWNRAAEVVYGPYGRLEGDERNALHLVFANPDHRRLLVDWEAVARASLAMFRADYARYAGEPDFEWLVGSLTRPSLEFARWWPRREVARPLAGQKRIDHPTAERMLFEYPSFGVGDSPDMRLIVFTPLEEEGTARKLEWLLGDRLV
jgi:MmyB-like transcription regulator ligand binding domain